MHRVPRWPLAFLPLFMASLVFARHDDVWSRLLRLPRFEQPIRVVRPPDGPRPEPAPSMDWLDPAVAFEPDIPYAGTDHPSQRLDLLLPKRPRDDRPLPVLVYIHGGAWMSGDKAMGHAMLNDLVAGGEYAGVAVNYRLVHEGTWPAQIHDCKAAIRWVRAHAGRYNLDPDRIAVRGESSGGHLVSMLGTGGGVEELEGDLGPHTDQSSRVRCVVDEYSPSDLLSLGDDGLTNFYPVVMLIGGDLRDRRANAVSASPIAHVSADDPPFLIIHGTSDPCVPFPQSARLHAALGAAGVETRFLRVEGGGHGGWSNPEIPARIRRFLDRHLRDADLTIADGPIPNDDPATG